MGSGGAFARHPWHHRQLASLALCWAEVGGEATEHSQAARSALLNALVEVTLRPVGAAIVEKPVTKKKAGRQVELQLQL